MFNPDPRIERQSLGGARAVWIVDGFVSDPQALRQRAIDSKTRFAAAPFNAYPGLEWRMGPELDQPLGEFFMLHLRKRMGARRTLSMYSRLSIATLQPTELSPLQRVCHRDRMGSAPGEAVVACTAYLFDEPELGGTAFYEPKKPLAEVEAQIRHWHTLSREAFTAETGWQPAYLTQSNDWFECVGNVPARFNRAVFYDGSGFHSSHIGKPSLLSPEPAHGRLTLNAFFVCRAEAR
jgi:hypothetical protein